MSDKLAFSSGVEFLQAADGEASAGPRKFRIVAYTGAPIRQSWSREPVVIDMAGMTLPQTVPIVVGHDYAIGSILGQGTPSVQGGQLIVEGEILADNDNARQVLALAAAGYQWQASVGADVGRHLRFGEDQITSVNGQTLQGPVRIVRASTLRETSFVTLGADRSTAVSIAAEAAEEIPMAADATTKPTDEVVETAVVAATAEVAVEPVSTPAVEADTSVLVAKLEAMTERLEKMEKLQATRDERPGSPAVHVVANVAPTAEVIEASFALQGNLPGIEKKYDAKVLEAAHKARREISLGEVLIQAAVANGYDGPRRVNASTLRPILAAAWATHSISGILSSTVNKFLLAGFDTVESAWRSISSVRSVNDFKTINQYRLNGAFSFEKVANGGELKNAAASDETRTISAETYGIMTSVTRTDLINDDLGALTVVGRVPERRQLLHGGQGQQEDRRHGPRPGRSQGSPGPLSEAEGQRREADGDPAACPADAGRPRDHRGGVDELHPDLEREHRGPAVDERVRRSVRGGQLDLPDRRERLLPPGLAGRPAGDGGGVPERRPEPDRGDGRGRLQRVGRPDAWLLRLRLCQGRGQGRREDGRLTPVVIIVRRAGAQSRPPDLTQSLP
jgi:hypothetical protein